MDERRLPCIHYDYKESPAFTEDMERSVLSSTGRVTHIKRWVQVLCDSTGNTWTFKPTWLIPTKDLEGGDIKKSVPKTFAEYLQNKKLNK